MSEEFPRLTEEQNLLCTESKVVPKLSKRLAPKAAPLRYGDLYSIGGEAQARAAVRFDQSKGVPFDAFTYEPVHCEMKRAIHKERKRTQREVTGTLSAAYEVLKHSKDEHDFLRDSDEESRAHVRDHFAGILGAMLTRWFSESSVAPTDDEIHAHVDRPRLRTKLLKTIEEMGDDGKVIALRHVQGLPWEQVSERSGIHLRNVQRAHKQALIRLAAILGRTVR